MSQPSASTPDDGAVRAELLAMLVCPETRQKLLPADAAVVARVNESIRAGLACNRAGERVQAPIHGGLVREDGGLLFPVRDGIPEMLLDGALPLG